MSEPGRQEDRSRLMRTLAIATTIPFVMLAAPAVGFVAGLYLDQWAGTERVFRVVFLLLGVVAGFYETYKLIRKLPRG